MNTEVLKRWLVDRALGALGPDEAALVEAYLARDPAARREAEVIAVTVAAARTTLRGDSSAGLPVLDVGAVARALAESSKRQNVKMSKRPHDGGERGEADGGGRGWGGAMRVVRWAAMAACVAGAFWLGRGVNANRELQLAKGGGKAESRKQETDINGMKGDLPSSGQTGASELARGGDLLREGREMETSVYSKAGDVRGGIKSAGGGGMWAVSADRVAREREGEEKAGRTVVRWISPLKAPEIRRL